MRRTLLRGEEALVTQRVYRGVVYCTCSYSSSSSAHPMRGSRSSHSWLSVGAVLDLIHGTRVTVGGSLDSFWMTDSVWLRRGGSLTRVVAGRVICRECALSVPSLVYYEALSILHVLVEVAVKEPHTRVISVEPEKRTKIREVLNPH